MSPTWCSELLDEERFLSGDIFIFDDEIVSEATGAAEKEDRPVVDVVEAGSGAQNMLDKLPPRSRKIKFSDVKTPSNSLPGG